MRQKSEMPLEASQNRGLALGGVPINAIHGDA
jgi:hypothetical protein